jgi:hypothetical protein
MTIAARAGSFSFASFGPVFLLASILGLAAFVVIVAGVAGVLYESRQPEA